MELTLRSHKRLCYITIIVLAVSMLLTGLFAFDADAATSYEGRGSKAEPYLVKTVDQLKGMRNNLSAHYKLSNTIDLSGVSDFTPIGNLEQPFSGSLTCDVGADNKPLYAIKNLKVKVDGVYVESTDRETLLKNQEKTYKKDKSNKWEAALFGYTSGASLTNILIMDASVTSNVVGSSRMNSDYSLNSGMDEQATAILVAIAQDTTITGCGVSGKVKTSSNHAGGLGGMVRECTIKNSYSFATVESTGVWFAGGFIADAKGTISNCFYQGGSVSGVKYVGGFIGGLTGGKITDCYATGTVSPSEATSFGCYYADGKSLELDGYAFNCFSLVKIEGRTKAQTSTKLLNNNYVTNEEGTRQIEFCAASPTDILSAFSKLSGWITKGENYPRLASVFPFTNSSEYPRKDLTPAATTESGTQSAGSTTELSDSSVSGSSDNESTTSSKSTITEVDSSGNNGGISTAEKVLIAVLSVLTFVTLMASCWTMFTIVKKHKSDK